MRLKKRRHLFIALCAALLAVAPWSGSVRADGLLRRLDAILAQKAPSWQVSARVVGVKSGKVHYSLHAHRPMIPASTNKIITSIAALEILGPAAPLSTRIYARGRIRNGRLIGDIIIRGGGDPNISGRFHDGDPLALPRRWARHVKASGIISVSGDVIADDTVFDREFLNPHWPQEQYLKWYQAEVSGLAFNDNCADVRVRTWREGRRWRLTVIPMPDTESIRFINKLVVSAAVKSPTIVFDRPPAGNVITVRGRMPAKQMCTAAFHVTLHNVPLVFAEVFRRRLLDESIVVLGRPRVTREAIDYGGGDLKLLVNHTTPLARSIRVMNKRSQNFYAECVLKLIGRKRFGRGSFKTGTEAVKAFLFARGFNPETVRYVDGSGLARANRVTAYVLTELLRFALRRSFADVFIDSLAAGGEPDSTMRKRLARSPYKGRVRAKTGSIRKVTALAGYVLDGAGEPALAFAILINNASDHARARKLQDDMCRALVDWLDRHR